MALAAKRTEADHLRELERSQPEEIEKADLVIGKAGMGPAPISIRLSKALLERLDRLAAREHRKRSNLIQHILWSYVHQLEDVQKSERQGVPERLPR